MSSTLNVGDVIEVTVERPAVGGPMVARGAEGLVLVTGAIPGERVRARIDRIARGVRFATPVAVDERSPDRRDAFDDPSCGGCLYSHIAYDRQLVIKRQVIADAFRRLARMEPPAVGRVVPSREDGYRMRARLHVQHGRIGFFREGTHHLCDPRGSRQLLSATCDALDRLAAASASLGDVVREVELSENVDAAERTLHLVTSQPVDPRALASLVGLAGSTPPPYVTDTLSIGQGTIRLRRHVRAFFQGNRYLLGDLVEHVTGLVPFEGVLLDLYAGTGLFAIAAAELRAATVVAVEGDRFAADDLRANALVAQGRVTAIRSEVETFVRALRAESNAAERPSAADIVIVDPPRIGLSSDALTGVVELQPSQLIYVSCDIATLARDARRFVDAGFSIQRVDAFDLFPNTPHVETVVLFGGPPR